LARDSLTWKINSQTEKIISEIFERTDVSMNDKVSQVSLILTSFLINQVKPSKKKKMVEILKDAIDPNSQFKQKLENQGKGSYYSNNFQKIYLEIGQEEIQNWRIAHFMILLHEFTHAIRGTQKRYLFYIQILSKTFHNFTLTPKLFSPLITYIEEKHAIGAQWELASRIPKEYREQALKIIKMIINEEELNTNEVITGREVFPESINLEILYVMRDSFTYAHLSKKEFIKSYQQWHNYTFSKIFKKQNQIGKIKQLYILIGSLTLLNFIYDDEHDILTIPPVDLYLLLKLYSALIPYRDF